MTSRRSFLALAAAAPVAALVPAVPAAATAPDPVLEHRFDGRVLFWAETADGAIPHEPVFTPVRCATLGDQWVIVSSPRLHAELDVVAGIAAKPEPLAPITGDVWAHAYIDGERCFGRVIFSRDAAGRWRAEGEDGHVSACPPDADPLAWALDQFEEQYAVEEARSAAGGTDPA